MRKGPLLFAAILVLALGTALFWYRSRMAGTNRPEDGASPAAREIGGRIAPPFTLKDIDGNSVSSSRFAGKATVINFFATWCPPCREEIPGFVEVHERYRGRGLEVVGISLDTDTRGNLPRFIAENRIGYRILLGDIATTRAYGGVGAIPTTVFVGKDGVVAKVHIGYIDRNSFENEVKKIL